MAQHSPVGDPEKRGDDTKLDQAQPATPAMLQVLMRAHLMRGALEQARAAADLLAALAGQTNGLAVLIQTALELGRVQMARMALWDADTKGHLAPHEAALIRARIAQSQGDMTAARAILVSAIEATPDQAAPRRAWVEVMVATGTAADARAVLHHLGAGMPGSTPAQRVTE